MVASNWAAIGVLLQCTDFVTEKQQPNNGAESMRTRPIVAAEVEPTVTGALYTSVLRYHRSPEAAVTCLKCGVLPVLAVSTSNLYSDPECCSGSCAT